MKKISYIILLISLLFTTGCGQLTEQVVDTGISTTSQPITQHNVTSILEFNFDIDQESNNNYAIGFEIKNNTKETISLTFLNSPTNYFFTVSDKANNKLFQYQYGIMLSLNTISIEPGDAYYLDCFRFQKENEDLLTVKNDILFIYQNNFYQKSVTSVF
jgi:hypothetical protein